MNANNIIQFFSPSSGKTSGLSMASTTSTASSNPTSDSEMENIPMDCTLLAELEDEADDLPDPDEEDDEDDDDDDDDEDNEENEDEYEEVCIEISRGNLRGYVGIFRDNSSVIFVMKLNSFMTCVDGRE